MNERELFDAVRIIKGKPLTQADVDLINKALVKEVISAAVSGRHVSREMIAFIQSHEGLARILPNGLIASYPDPGSVDGRPWTIGYGSTGDDITKDTVWTREQCTQRFLRDIARFETGVTLLIGNAPTTQAQFDALVSFAYNVGLDIDEDTKAEGLGDSTLLKCHLRGDYEGAVKQFGAWVYNGRPPKVMPGLVTRRAKEADWYAGH
jgi:lysozyme